MLDLDKIHYILNNRKEKESPRNYLGLSMIGNSCHRYIQLYHYWTFGYEVTSRVRRLLDFGHLAEKFMIEDLAKVGIIVSGSRKELVGSAGHWYGHIDGEFKKYLVEFKTHNDKSFKALSKGLRESKPEYYDQVQAYMGYSDFKSCIHVNYCKNTSEYKIFIIDFDLERFKDLQRKEMEVLLAESLLPRIGNNNISWFKCKMCNAKDVCFGKKEVSKSCRTCANVDVCDNGIWKCSKHRKELTIDEQKSACDDYLEAGMFDELQD